MKEALLAAVAALGLTFVASTAQAATITETTDFSDSLASPTALGTLDLGLNSISGALSIVCSLTGSCAGITGDIEDSFSVDIAAGTQLTDVTINFRGLRQISSLSASGSFFDAIFPSNGGAFSLLSAGSETGTVSFNIENAFLGTSGSEVNTYRLDLTVAAIPGTPTPVPLPAGFPLLLAGLGGFAALRKRKTA